jgi:hypothetical protein
LLLGAALAAAGAPCTPARGQRLTAVELGGGVTAVVARHVFAGAEVGLGVRPGGQSRLALAVAAGTEHGRAAARVQFTAQFLVTPAARGAGLYGGLGAAVAGRRGSAGAGYLALLLGVEGAPGRARRGAWYGELGLCGGVRAAAGWRVRRFPAWWQGGGGTP